MSQSWPVVTLGEVIAHRKEFIEILDLEQYRRCRVQLHAKGIVLRDVVSGADIRTKRQQVCRTGEFLVAEIDAKLGGFGIVPAELESAIVSSHYFLFTLNEAKLERSFLDYYIRTAAFQDQVTAQGSTNYAAIRPQHVLEYTIPLPPPDEQRRIVARIEALAGRVAEAQRLRQQTVEEAKALTESYTDKILVELASKFESRKFSEICTTITDGDHITPQFSTEGIKFIFVGNVSSGHLHFNNCKYVTEEYFAKIRPQRVPKRGDILYSAVGATLGVPALVDVNEPFCFQRHIAILKPNPDLIDSRFAWHLLHAGQIYRKAWSLTTGSAQPTIPLKAIRSLEIPIPPIQEQRQIVTYLDDLYARVDALKQLQTETAAELDALLPAVLDRAFRGEW